MNLRVLLFRGINLLFRCVILHVTLPSYYKITSGKLNVLKIPMFKIIRIRACMYVSIAARYHFFNVNMVIFQTEIAK